MYIRKRVRGQDDPVLINMVIKQFKVKNEVITAIIEQAHEILVVCDEQDTIVGFVSYRFKLLDMVYVDYVVLDEEHQGRGIASKFLPVFEKHCLKQGIRVIYGTVDSDNTDALRLFERWGFTVKGQLGSSVIIEKHLQEIRNKNAPPPYVKKLSEPPGLTRNK
ncbi:GNAT family N-acetyltransferase [Fictibacillus aquaticus]|uniref:N-acetyltransferase domain-containing protein n=1 Tax=Fictibacillus aquaticus TaxID=2021314 RepID=A0A235F7K5_9BACL|nr:GNAT family N-acetyltransferase [Fictibacillus aquaticus]OYD57228.1 hypothetical protein CGZ90_11095 [Fictibacillus aquaticus]